jgi:hypothetical protein
MGTTEYEEKTICTQPMWAVIKSHGKLCFPVKDENIFIHATYKGMPPLHSKKWQPRHQTLDMHVSAQGETHSIDEKHKTFLVETKEEANDTIYLSIMPYSQCTAPRCCQHVHKRDYDGHETKVTTLHGSTKHNSLLPKKYSRPHKSRYPLNIIAQHEITWPIKSVYLTKYKGWWSQAIYAPKNQANKT